MGRGELRGRKLEARVLGARGFWREVKEVAAAVEEAAAAIKGLGAGERGEV